MFKHLYAIQLQTVAIASEQRWGLYDMYIHALSRLNIIN